LNLNRDMPNQPAASNAGIASPVAIEHNRTDVGKPGLSRNDVAEMGEHTPPACGFRRPAGNLINLFPPPNGAEESDEAKSRP
jgi:hypothetical protein